MALEIFPKWIIEDGHLVIGKVTNHRDLAVNTANVKGGGWFEVDLTNKTILLYGSSSDYGYTEVSDIKAAIAANQAGSFSRPDMLEGFTFKYSTRYKLEDAQVDAVDISLL